MTYGRQVQCLQFITHVTTEISERERLPSLKSLVCLGSLITLVIIISERVLYCLEVASKDG